MPDRRDALAATFDEIGDTESAAAVRRCQHDNPDGCDTCEGLAEVMLDD